MVEQKDRSGVPNAHRDTSPLGVHLHTYVQEEHALVFKPCSLWVFYCLQVLLTIMCPYLVPSPLSNAIWASVS